MSIMAASCAITACGGGSGSSSPASIVGVWDASEDLGNEGFDEFYTVIGSDGSLTDYDYAGDSYDNAGNCYWIYRNYGAIELVEDKIYTVVYYGVSSVNFATIDVTKSKMTVTITSPQEEEPFTYKRSNKRVSDFIPECDESVGRSHATGTKPKLHKRLATQ